MQCRCWVTASPNLGKTNYELTRVIMMLQDWTCISQGMDMHVGCVLVMPTSNMLIFLQCLWDRWGFKNAWQQSTGWLLMLALVEDLWSFSNKRRMSSNNKYWRVTLGITRKVSGLLSNFTFHVQVPNGQEISGLMKVEPSRSTF